MGTPIDDDVSFLLARANALSLAAGNAALADTGLRVRSYSVLALSTADPVLSQREMADVLRLDPSQVVALVDELESRELVQRRPDAADRRTRTVVATQAGRVVLARARRSTSAAQRASLAALSADERATLTDLLRRLAFPADPG